jgi:phosphate transport system substrate-binding protein
MKTATGVAPIIDGHREAITDDQIAHQMRTPKPGEIVQPSKASRSAAYVFLLLLISGPAWADVKIHGATTVAFAVMKPHKAQIEELVGAEIAMFPSSSTRGLVDLIQGRADIAMLAEPLDTAAIAANAKQPGLVNPEDFVGRHVGDAVVEFIVHPSNPIQKLTQDQLARLYSGKIKNWSEIGGNNQPVMIVGEPTSTAYRMIKETLAISYVADLRAVHNTNRTSIIVAQAPGALGNISTAHDVPERGKFKVVDTPLKLQLHLYLAIRRDASELIKRVVDAAASLGGR